MKKKITYSDENLGDFKIIKDFLPKPDELIFKDDVLEVKVPLNRRSVEFFKKQAKKHRTSYQHIIRKLVDGYAGHYDH